MRLNFRGGDIIHHAPSRFPCRTMDPLSIATGVTSLAKLCSQLFTFVNDMNLVDERVNTLVVEIDSLRTVLVAISNVFSDPVQSKSALSSPIAVQHWQNIQQMLGNCEDTLNVFGSMVGKIDVPERGVLRKPAKLITFRNEEGRLSLIKQKLTTYKLMLTMSLQSLTLFVPYLSESNMF
jgi:hypothetical protein